MSRLGTISLFQSFHKLSAEVYGHLRIKFFIILLAQLVTGLLENLGILTLLPIIYVALDLQATEDNTLYNGLVSVLDALHIPLELEYLLVIFVSLIALKAFISFTTAHFAQVEVLKIVADLRSQLIKALFNARWAFFTKTEPGKYGNILTGELIKTSSAISGIFLFLNGLIISIFYLLSAFLLSYKLTLLVFVLGILSARFLSPLIRKARSAGLKNSKTLNTITAFMINTLHGMKSIKAMRIEERSLKVLLADNQTVLEANRQTNFAALLLKYMQEPIVAVALMVTVFLSLHVLDLPLPNLAVLLLIFNRSLIKILDLQSIIQNFSVNEAGYLNVRDAIDEIETYAEDDLSQRQAEPFHFKQSLNVHNLTTRIDGRSIIKDVSFQIPATGIHAFIGPSGSGKTSLIDTLITLRTEYDGDITYDGVNLRQIDRAAVRSNVGYVMQEIQLYHTSIRENVLIAKPDATEQEIIEVLTQVNAMDFIQKLELGLDSIVGEGGSMLSGGQRQRIALARALIRKPDILVFDEVTSALDEENTSVIMNMVKTISRQRCVLLISHDQNAIQWADQVFEIKDQTVRKLK